MHNYNYIMLSFLLSVFQQDLNLGLHTAIFNEIIIGTYYLYIQLRTLMYYIFIITLMHTCQC